MIEFSKNLVAFLKNHRVFLILSLMLIAFLLECFMVRNFALKQIIWLIIITLVNLYICERKFKVDDESIRYFNVLFFFATWVGLLLFFFFGFLYYYVLNFPVLELTKEAQGLVAQGLHWRTFLQLAGDILLISVIITLNLEKNIRNLEDCEGRFEKKVRERVQGKMWIFKYHHWFMTYTCTLVVMASAIGWSWKLQKKIFPYVIEHHLMQIIGLCYTMFLLWTIFRLLYIMLKTIRREEEILARKKK